MSIDDASTGWDRPRRAASRRTRSRSRTPSGWPRGQPTCDPVQFRSNARSVRSRRWSGLAGHVGCSGIPNRVNLRKAAPGRRSSCPRVFALLVVTGNTPSALFGAFGSFAALVFADFGGALPAASVPTCAARDRRRRAGRARHRLSPTRSGPRWSSRSWSPSPSPCRGALGGYFAAGGDRDHARLRAGGDDTRGRGRPLRRASSGGSSAWWWPASPRSCSGRCTSVIACAPRPSPCCARWPPPWRSRRRNDDSMPHGPRGELADRAGVVYRPAGSITRERALVALVIAARRLVPLLEKVTAADRSPSADTLPAYARAGAARRHDAGRERGRARG